MTHAVILRRRAEDDIRIAFQWYEAQEPALFGHHLVGGPVTFNASRGLAKQSHSSFRAEGAENAGWAQDLLNVNVTHLRPADYSRQTWKNGGGTTTELARDASGERWLWRLSIADVERSGPFSDFTGYRRIITLLDGPGMALSFDALPPVVLDVAYRPFAFDGALRTDCRLLGGPIRDMNLIVDDARVAASLDVRMPGAMTPLAFAVHGCALLHAIRGRFDARVGEGQVALQPGDTLRIDNGSGETLSASALGADAVLAVIAITRR